MGYCTTCKQDVRSDNKCGVCGKFVFVPIGKAKQVEASIRAEIAKLRKEQKDALAKAGFGEQAQIKEQFEKRIRAITEPGTDKPEAGRFW